MGDTSIDLSQYYTKEEIDIFEGLEITIDWNIL